MIDSRQRLVLMALILIAFVWRIWRLDFQSLWRDEVDAIFNRGIEAGGKE